MNRRLKSFLKGYFKAFDLFGTIYHKKPIENPYDYYNSLISDSWNLIGNSIRETMKMYEQ